MPVTIALHKGRWKNSGLPPAAQQTTLNTARWLRSKCLSTHSSTSPAGLQSNLCCSLSGAAHTDPRSGWPKWGEFKVEEQLLRWLVHTLWKTISFLLARPIYKLASLCKTLFTQTPVKKKQTEGRKKKMLNDFQPHKLPPSTPTKSDKEIKSVSPFPLKASVSSQSLLKWKGKSHLLPCLNSCWKPPESLWSKLMGLDGNIMPYCFGMRCQLMTWQNDLEDTQEKYI